LSDNSKKEKIKELGFRKQPSEATARNMVQSRIKSFYSARGKPVSFGMKTAKSGKNSKEIFLTKSIIKKIKAKLGSAEYRLAVKFQTQLGLRISNILEEIPSEKYVIEQIGKDKNYFIKDFRTKKMGVVINYLFFTDEFNKNDTICKRNTRFN
jgi:hypothetical protein